MKNTESIQDKDQHMKMGKKMNSMSGKKVVRGLRCDGRGKASHPMRCGTEL